MVWILAGDRRQAQLGSWTRGLIEHASTLLPTSHTLIKGKLHKREKEHESSRLPVFLTLRSRLFPLPVDKHLLVFVPSYNQSHQFSSLTTFAIVVPFEFCCIVIIVVIAIRQ